jgi:hypothetical protein
VASPRFLRRRRHSIDSKAPDRPNPLGTLDHGPESIAGVASP